MSYNLRVVKEWRPDLERFIYTIREVSRDENTFIEHEDELLSVGDPTELAQMVKDVQAALRKPVLYLEVKHRWVEEDAIDRRKSGGRRHDTPCSICNHGYRKHKQVYLKHVKLGPCGGKCLVKNCKCPNFSGPMRDYGDPDAPNLEAAKGNRRSRARSKRDR